MGRPNPMGRKNGSDGGSLRRDGGCIPFASPGLLQAAPPTHKQAEHLSFKGTSALPVLPSPESVQLWRGWTLSDLGGCKRYNTLDLASKIVCQRWAATPLWKLPAGIDRPPLAGGGIRSTPDQQGSRPDWKPRVKGLRRPLKPWLLHKLNSLCKTISSAPERMYSVRDIRIYLTVLFIIAEEIVRHKTP